MKYILIMMTTALFIMVGYGFYNMNETKAYLDAIDRDLTEIELLVDNLKMHPIYMTDNETYSMEIQSNPTMKGLNHDYRTED